MIVSRFVLVVLALAFLASSVFAYYPYGPEIRVYGTDNYLRTGTYPAYYTNYYPETYSAYSGAYESYTGFYYRPAAFAFPDYVVVSPYYYSGSYWRPYYYRDYPEATSYVSYNTTPTTYVTSGAYYAYPSVSAGYYSTSYTGYRTCTESYCVRLN